MKELAALRKDTRNSPGIQRELPCNGTTVNPPLDSLRTKQHGCRFIQNTKL